MFSPLLHRLQDSYRHAATPISRHCVRLAPELLAETLPMLGSVLYMPMQPHASSVWRMPRGLLVEDMQLAPLLQVHWLVVAGMITVDGPREWFECMDRNGRQCARLYLLPDTDYLAWDALPGKGVHATSPARRLHQPRPVNARMLHFNRRRLGGLDVLGVESAVRASSLSAQVAERIGRADALSWQPGPGG